LDPESSEVQFLKGKIHFQIRNSAYDQAMQQRERTMAIQAFQRANRTGSTRSELNELLAILFFETNLMDSADVYFTKVIAADTTRNAAYFSNRAICRYNLNRFEDAADDYTSALSIDSMLGNARGERGICYARLGRREAACSDLQRAVSEGFSDYQSDLQENCR